MGHVDPEVGKIADLAASQEITRHRMGHLLSAFIGNIHSKFSIWTREQNPYLRNLKTSGVGPVTTLM